jgi:hypothetical protein
MSDSTTLIPLTIASLGATATVAGTDLIAVQQVGASVATKSPASAYFSGGTAVLYAGTVAINTRYMMNANGTGAPPLPALSGLSVGQFVEFEDIADNIGTYPQTITAYSGDVILDHATSAGTFPWQTSNTILRLRVTSSGWRAFVYSG